MWNETNPTSLYLGTTWELISAGKYVQTGNTALATGGNNSITIAKANLPNIKLNTTSTTATVANHYHYVFNNDTNGNPISNSTFATKNGPGGSYADYNMKGTGNRAVNGKTSDSGGGVTGSFSLQTETLGSGTPLNIQPSYITLKFWKRTS